VVEAGAVVLGGARANLIVEGALEARGAAGRPVLFAPDTIEAAWGGIHLAPGARATLRQTLVTGAGGDGARAYGHSSSQPVVFADGAILDWEGGGAIDNPGKGPSSRLGQVTLRDLVVARCDQGGEHSGTRLLIDRTHYMELPDADGRLDDDDNDGLHLDPGGRPPEEAPMRIQDSVFSLTEDDGIDHNGVVLDVERVWIEGAAHEGIAGSAGGRLTITDAVVTRCKQGIEAGWGAPEVVVSHALVAGNEVGLRWGDEYDMENAGTLRAANVVVVGNRRANVLSLWEGGGNVARPEAIDVACSRVDTPGWDGRAGNEPGLPAGVPLFDATGCVAPAHRTRAACPAAPLGPRGCP
jgi:hypothetical protein